MVENEDNHPITYSGEVSFISEIPPDMHNIIFYGDHAKTFLTLTHDGKLIAGEGLSMDEATQHAAKMLAEHYGRQLVQIKLEEEEKLAKVRSVRGD